MKRILFITTGLETGGAEGVLVSLISGCDRTKFKPFLINLGHEGPKLQEVLKSDCLYQRIDFHRGFLLFQLFTFLETVWSFKPHIIQGWMYQGSLFALVAKLAWPFSKCFLGIRNASFEDKFVSKNTKICISLTRILMMLSKNCIFPSKQSKLIHEEAGFLKVKSKDIENGCDTNQFFPVPRDQKDLLRQKWGVNPEKFLIGFISRFHSHKDPETFLRVVQRVKNNIPEAQFICVGQGLSIENQKFIKKVKSLDLEDMLHLKGVVDPVFEIYQMLDLLLLTSVSEAFPNVILEAMSTEIPCVSTDVGNVKELLGPFYHGAACGDVENLAREIESLRKAPKFEVPGLRERVISHFGLKNMVINYQNLWNGVM